MELPTYIYERMTSNEKRILTKDIERPTVIRGLYKPRAGKFTFDKVVNMFGSTQLPVEVYNTPESTTTDAYMSLITIPNLIKHWNKKGSPSLYCAEVDLFEQKISPELLGALRNPNTTGRRVESLMLYLGNNHSSGLHLHVNSDFILNQLYGTKTVYICEDPNVHKNSTFSFSKSNFAKEDFLKMDHSKMKIYKVTLQPGDSLMIPPWSWHATQGHGVNMSITQIFNRMDCSYLLKYPNLILDYYLDDNVSIAIALISIFFIFLYFRRQFHRVQ
jgi:hypothetical protein